MGNYTKRYAVVLLTIFLTTGFSFANELSNTADTGKKPSPAQEVNEELVTTQGIVYIGMPVEKLYDVFQENDRILIPESVLNKGCHVFRDWTSNNPNDTITFFVRSKKVSGWQKGYVASCQNEGSEYEYDNNTHIDVWFFPPDKARWDGTKVDLLSWNKLNQAQKIMFIKEYIQQLNLRNNAKMDIDIDKYILGMNYYSSNCPRECENIPASGAINNLLVSDGKAAEAKM